MSLDMPLRICCNRRTVLRGFAVGTAVAAVCDAGESALAAQASHNRKLPRAGLEAANISPEGVLAFIDAVEQKVGGLHSFMLLRHGHVAAEGWWAPYAPALPHMLYSLSKSFTSTAVGLAVADGKLSVDDPVISLFSNDAPALPTRNLSAMRVRHLLTMNTGHDKDATGATTAAPDGNWVKAFLSLPVEHAPGSKFVYNSAATYMLSAIVQKLTGMTVLDYLRPRLFEPLGIDGPTWETCPRGINTGGWGLSVRTEDIARFGQLYLQKGTWNGRELVPASWVAAATSKQVPNGDGGASDWAQGYGYQFWRSRHGAFRGDGAFGQYCVVMPEQDAVLAITSGLGDMQAVLNAAWDNLLPAMQPAHSAQTSSDVMLKQRIKKLSVPLPKGEASSPTAKQVSGKTYTFNENPPNLQSATFTFDKNGCTVILRDADGEHKVTVGDSEWVKGSVPKNGHSVGLGDHLTGKIAARGAWTAADTYTMKVCFTETPYIRTIAYRFAGDQVTVTTKMNVGFGPTDRPAIIGRAA